MKITTYMVHLISTVKLASYLLATSRNLHDSYIANFYK